MNSLKEYETENTICNGDAIDGSEGGLDKHGNLIPSGAMMEIVALRMAKGSRRAWCGCCGSMIDWSSNDELTDSIASIQGVIRHYKRKSEDALIRLDECRKRIDELEKIEG